MLPLLAHAAPLGLAARPLSATGTRDTASHPYAVAADRRGDIRRPSRSRRRPGLQIRIGVEFKFRTF